MKNLACGRPPAKTLPESHLIRLLLSTVVLWACNPKLDAPWCADSEHGDAQPGLAQQPTYYQDVKPIIEARCLTCHVDGGIAPVRLDRFEDVFSLRTAIAESVKARTMPPYQAAPCCTEYYRQWSLTSEEIQVLNDWASNPLEGSQAMPGRLLPAAGGLSQVDVTLKMSEPYRIAPKAGRVDDYRCFLLDWPIDAPVFITGLNPMPGNRRIVHHLIVAALDGDAVRQATAMDKKDPGPGYDCQSGLGELSLKDLTVFGGSLIGSDFPDDLGRPVKAGSKILLNIHYTSESIGSTASDQELTDQSSIQFRVAPSAQDFEGLVIANPAWLIDDGMKIKAGEANKAFWFRYNPAVFTQGKSVWLRSVTPHMHNFGKRFRIHRIHDGKSECLLEIPKWEFGWEQTYWFETPKKLGPDDQLYLECVFDNSAENQPTKQAPRDIAWGTDGQDMCAGFLNFTREP
ncbi:MAG: hypothetical protein SFV15_16390 [Polyangiaceae bacterium]|nr:hypothetical protein [Polyangiaceae bacterium]